MKLRRVLVTLFALSMIVSVMAVSALAAKPVLADVPVVCATEHSDYPDDIQKAAAVLRDGMKQRQEKITIEYQIDQDSFEGTNEAIQELFGQIYECALMHTGVPDEGDYLRWHLGNTTWRCSYSLADGVYHFTTVFNCGYYTTKKQEVAVTNRIAEIKKQLKLNADISDYQKVVNIYNFICNSDMDYDYVHLNDQNYKLQYAVYGALVNKTAVCQGFASLFYRLALEAGVDARLISGTGIDQNGQMNDHAWNIVELNGAYYYVDTTWDLNRWDYAYFLKNEKEFVDHKPDAEYIEVSFTSAYPVSKKAYVHPKDLSVSEKNYAYTVRYGHAMITKYLGKEANVNVPEVLGGYPVHAIGQEAFRDCGSIASVTIPDSVTSIGSGAFYGCTDLKQVVFYGDAPSENPYIFFGVTATVYYPKNNQTWTKSVRNSLGSEGNITWSTDQTVQPTVKPTATPTAKPTPKPVKITTQPKTTYVKSGETAKVTVKATGDSLKYAWYYKNKGASKFTKSSITSASYSTKMTSKTKDRQLYCVVKDKYGKTVKTNPVYLRMAASITTQPKTTYTKNGSAAKVTVKAAGDGLKYTWYYKSKGASKFTKSSVTSASYSTKMSSTTKDRQVYCIVKDKYGKSAKTSTVYLRMAASITTQPKTVSVKKNTTAKVTVKAAGDGLKYTWYVKNAGAKKFTKTTVKTAAYSVKMTSSVKNRQVYCVVTDKYGKTVKSNTVTMKMK